MDLELTILIRLSEHERLRISPLASLLERSSKEVRKTLQTLKKRGNVSEDVLFYWSLTDSGRAVVENLNAFLDGGDAAEEPHPINTPLVLEPGSEDESQVDVARQGAGARQVVEAGPGSGKTHTACRRVLRLCKELNPHQILFISFTRVAVHEMRSRVEALDPDASRITILTLDQLAYRLHGVLEGDHNASIKRALENRPSWQSTVSRLWRHVIIDEAQDLIGIRAELLAHLVRDVCQHESHGFTLFHDPAQAIYDWTGDDEQDDDRRVATPPSLLEELGPWLSTCDPPVRYKRLRYMHRSSQASLLMLMAQARPVVVGEQDGGPEAIHRLLDELDDGATCAQHTEALEPPEQSTVWLFRARCSAVQASWRLSRRGIPHRLRFGGLPPAIHPEVAGLVNRAETRRVAREHLEALAQSSDGWSSAGPQRLLRLVDDMIAAAPGRRGGLDTVRLAQRIASKPPQALCVEDERSDASLLTLSTIHGYKGREADHVHFFRGKHGREKGGLETCRLLYVAITRARQDIRVHRGPRLWLGSHRGRPWCRSGKRRPYRFLTGLEGDLDPVMGLGVALDDASSSTQRLLEGFDGRPRRLSAVREGFRFRLLLEDGTSMGALSPSFTEDLESFFRQSKYSQSLESLGGLWWIGVTVVALDPDVSPDSPLAKPWRHTRIWLAPIVVGLAFRTRQNAEGA